MTLFETLGEFLAKITSFMPKTFFKLFGNWILLLPIIVGVGAGAFLAIT